MKSLKSIQSLAKEIHKNSRDKRFWDDYETPTNFHWIATKMALINSEVCEALEELRKGGGRDKIGEELADVIIRTIDLAEGMGIDIAQKIVDKIEKNKLREPLHGKYF